MHEHSRLNILTPELENKKSKVISYSTERNDVAIPTRDDNGSHFLTRDPCDPSIN